MSLIRIAKLSFPTKFNDRQWHRPISSPIESFAPERTQAATADRASWKFEPWTY